MRRRRKTSRKSNMRWRKKNEKKKKWKQTEKEEERRDGELIDIFQRHVNLSRFILCLEVKELDLFDILIYIFLSFLKSFFFAHGLIKYE